MLCIPGDSVINQSRLGQVQIVFRLGHRPQQRVPGPEGAGAEGRGVHRLQHRQGAVGALIDVRLDVTERAFDALARLCITGRKKKDYE